MKKSARYISYTNHCSLPVLLLLTQVVAADPFVESSGFVYFEAEDSQVGGDWISGTALDHFSGASYIEWNGPDLFDPAGAGRDTITYQFEITNPGNYELRWRTRIAKGDSNTESNDSYVRFPSGVNIAGEEPLFGWQKVFMGHHGAWFWDAKVNDHVGANVRQFFPAGTHVMEVSGRSNGHAIDKIALYRYESLELSPNDLDIRSGTPQSIIDGNAANAVSVNNDPRAVSEIPLGLQYTPGECTNGTLALQPVADVHLLNGGLLNTGSLEVSPLVATTLMRFDTSIAPKFDTAELELTVIDGDQPATIEYALLDGTGWAESDSALDPAPQYVLQLALEQRTWNSNTRYSIPLSAGNLQSDIINMSIAAVSAEGGLTVASRENSQQMPLLVMRGSGDFCETYRANVTALGAEAVEMESTSTGATDDTTAAGTESGESMQTEVTGVTQSNSGGGSGGGAFGLLSLLALVGLVTGRPRRGEKHCSIHANQSAHLPCHRFRQTV